MSRFCVRVALVKSEAVTAGLVGDASSGHGIVKRYRRWSRTESKRRQKTFGETFGEARATSLKIQTRNHPAGGKAATGTGYVGPGFHNWPSGHIDQTPDRKRHRSICPNGATHTSPGQRPGNRIPENRCVLKEHRIGEVGGDVRGAENWRRPM